MALAVGVKWKATMANGDYGGTTEGWEAEHQFPGDTTLDLQQNKGAALGAQSAVCSTWQIRGFGRPTQSTTDRPTDRL